MTVQELLNGVIYAGVLAGAITGIGTLLHFAMVRPIRAFLRKEIVTNLVDIKSAVEHNQTAVEHNTEVTEELRERLEEHIANGGHVHP